MKLPIWMWPREEEEMQGGEREERRGICRGRLLGFGGLGGELVLARLGRGPGVEASQLKGPGQDRYRHPAVGPCLQIPQGLGRSGAWDLNSCTSGQPLDSSVWAGWEVMGATERQSRVAECGEATGRPLACERSTQALLLLLTGTWKGPNCPGLQRRVVGRLQAHSVFSPLRADLLGPKFSAL